MVIIKNDAFKNKALKEWEKQWEDFKMHTKLVSIHIICWSAFSFT